MAKLEDFEANGVYFPDSRRDDIDALVERIPDDGTLHLAILQPPYLELINKGMKTIESRFNMKRAAPFGKVAVGDLILLKETGKPITNYFFAASVNLIDLSEVPVSIVREQYGDAICAQDEDTFWRDRENSHYATLLGIGERGLVDPFAVIKRDQRGWVSFTRGNVADLSLF
jgi:hypothetical protein